MKFQKKLGLLYRATRVLDTTALKSLYFPFIHSYLNYGNIVRDSASKTELRKLAKNQKQTLMTLPYRK